MPKLAMRSGISRVPFTLIAMRVLFTKFRLLDAIKVKSA
jgi:hypothetical protein